jgi:hypothetical protein
MARDLCSCDEETPVVMLEPPTAEMRFWARAMNPLLAAHERGGWGGRVVATALVTPLAHVANMSFDFQLYLYGVFHRSRFAKVVHRVSMPAIVLSMLACAAQLHPMGAWVAAAAFATCYVAHAALNAAMLLGLVMVSITGLLAWLATAWASAPLSWWAQPAVCMLVLSAAETLSHIAEPDVPPRASGTPDWVPLGRFYAGDGERPTTKSFLARLPRSVFMFFAGVGNELTSSWRLLPVDVMHAMWALGYQPARRERVGKLRERALASGNPAIDAVGIGGARLRVSPEDGEPLLARIDGSVGEAA